MKVVSAAILTIVCAVTLLLSVCSSLNSGPSRIRIDVPKTEVIVSPQDVEPSAATVMTPYEMAVARMRQCDINAVIYHALQSSGGGAGPICVID